MNKKLIICNWKMYGNSDYAMQIQERLANFNNDNFHFVICPPYTLLHKFTSITLGGQNCSSELCGAYTGEISAQMLSESNAKYVILGHSERRKYFDEQPDLILCKIEQAIKANIKPIICVRKFSEDREYIQNIISKFSQYKIIIAYEPDSSIGSGISDSLDSIKENLGQIEKNKNISLIYGGSVNENNICDILKICDGVLIGKASVDIEKFDKILNAL